MDRGISAEPGIRNWNGACMRQHGPNLLALSEVSHLGGSRPGAGEPKKAANHQM